MAVEYWKPGTAYAPNTLVQANETGQVSQTDLTNADFEAGNTGWTLGSVATIDGVNPFAGSFALTCKVIGPLGFPASVTATNQDRLSVVPGQIIRANCQATTSNKETKASLGITFYNSGGSLILTTLGNHTISSVYTEISVVATAPADAVTVSVVCRSDDVVRSPENTANFDNIVWDYYFQDPVSVLLFKATQAGTGFSGTSEPVWPTVIGNTVVDNEVTWEAVAANIIIWKAVPILKSGSAEPTFPASAGATVVDNTILWIAESLRVQDENCPNSKQVAILASKIFAVDGDIIPFSATVNPLDWTTTGDAGYIPFGLNTYGSQSLTALGIYRSNLVAFNSEAFQMWQVDEDPNNFAILDAIPVGCRFPKSLSPVSNDLVFLTDEGIRSMGIAGASTNLQAGFFGKQIDPLVLEAIKGGEVPDALFFPGAGQYWLFFGEEAFVLTMNGGKADMSWSRYVFPSAIDDWTIQSGALYLRSGDKVWLVDDDTLVDDFGGSNVAFTGQVWWPYLDFGALGVTKMMIGFDTVADGTYTVSVGYNQKDVSQFTAPYTIVGDTLPGDVIPLPVSAPSLQFRLEFSGNQAWEWSASSFWLQDFRRTS